MCGCVHRMLSMMRKMIIGPATPGTSFLALVSKWVLKARNGLRMSITTIKIRVGNIQQRRQWGCNMSNWVDIRVLLRFEASADGPSASLIAVERHGELIALNFTVTCLSRLMLTLPKMIDAVVQQRGNHPGLRVVYPLDMLRVELAGDRTRILTLRTPDGFAISFTASAEKFAQIREIFAGGARRSGSASEKCSFSKRYTRQTIGACRRRSVRSRC